MFEPENRDPIQMPKIKCDLSLSAIRKTYYMLAVVACLLWTSVAAIGQGTTVILNERGFPSPDSISIPAQTLTNGFMGSHFVSASQLSAALADPSTSLLVLPYGSAYPEDAWPTILRYLERGGNLIVLGGKPFTRAAFHTDAGWELRPPSVAETLELFIADYQQTAGSSELHFEANPDVQPVLPAFAWKQSYSPVIRLSVTPLFPSEIGSTGDEDADLTTLAWGSRGQHHRSAPVYLIDHHKQRFVGGRWVFLACNPSPNAFDNPQLLADLQTIALRKQDRFTFHPSMPLFLPGEALLFHFEFADPQRPSANDILKLTVHADAGSKPQSLTIPLTADGDITLPQSAVSGAGFHTVDATLERNGIPIWTDHSGFWIRDLAYLNSGPKLTVDSDYFQLDGKPLPVVGTTYMASNVDRLFLLKPNAYIWDRDMQQIHAAGLQMIRTGIWSGWNRMTTSDNSASEATLRSIEAFLMTARRNHLTVQFNLFAFLPNSFGGENSYLDPVALHAQNRYIRSIVTPFHDVPFLAWDLINEPSANNNMWKTLPDNDPFEDAAWHTWLKQKYSDEAAILSAWAEPSFGIGRTLESKPTAIPPTVSAQDPFALPTALAFNFDGVRDGGNPLKVYDYFLFTQSVFTNWIEHQRATISSTGSSQLVTVGQDEGGVALRVSPSFFSPDVSFTTNHTWWDSDGILWASLAAKFPGKPMLVQELGEQRRLTQTAHMRLTPEQESWQLERKLAIAFVQGAGGMEWVWNVNAMMANDNEISIGAIRPDGTEKPEADVLAGFAQFASKHPESFTRITPPDVTIVTSQSFLYTGMYALALAAQKKSLRALTYYDHTPARMLPENRLDELGTPKLVLLPSAQALTNVAWQQLLNYVARGGCLLITGPVNRDEHWQLIDRMTPLHTNADLLPLLVRQSTFHISPNQPAIQLTYPGDVQQAPLELLRFSEGQAIEEIPHGSGKILWMTDPVELSEGYDATAAIYTYALAKAGVAAVFRQIKPLPPGILATPTMLPDAILYSFSSESLDDTDVDIQDSATHVRMHFDLPSQRGSMLLLQRSNGAILASYGVKLK
jgi:hypothetical protein